MTQQENKTGLAVLKVVVDNIVDDMKCFVTLDRFNPIEKIVWAIVMLIITSVIGAGLALLLK